MDNREHTITFLRNDHQYSFSCSPFGNQVTMEYSWGSKNSEVSRIEVYIQGTHPLTGNPLRREEYLFVFNSIHTRHVRTHSLYGTYTLRFTAFLYDGTVIRDYNLPYVATFDAPEAEPYIRYSITEASRGWKMLTINSNCYQMLHNRLWLTGSRGMHRVPDMYGTSARFCLATADDNLSLICTDKADACYLPKPVRE